MMTITDAPAATVSSEKQAKVTVEGATRLLLEDINALETLQQRRRHHLFSGNGVCSKQIVILPEGEIPKEFKSCVVSHLRGTFTLDDSTLHQAMAELHRRGYHVRLVEYHYCCIREDMVSYLVYQVDLLEPTGSN